MAHHDRGPLQRDSRREAACVRVDFVEAGDAVAIAGHLQELPARHEAGEVMTWLAIALYALAAYLVVASVIAALARLAGLPWGIARLAGIAWGPVMAWVVATALPLGKWWLWMKARGL